MNYMKNKHPNIKFTSEFEKNDYFSFLDVKITHNNQLVTSIFRKATFRGVYTNFKIFLPVAYKFGLVYTLHHRSFSICSSYEKIHEEIVLLKVVSATFLLVCIVCLKERTCETRKHVFFISRQKLFLFLIYIVKF